MQLCIIKQSVLISVSYHTVSNHYDDGVIYFYVATNAVVGTFMTPENFTALPTNSREIQFSWSSLSIIEADPTSMTLSYTLTCRPYASGVTSVMMTYTEAGSHTLGGFRPASEYNCSMFAFNSVKSGPSVSINVTTLDECK